MIWPFKRSKPAPQVVAEPPTPVKAKRVSRPLFSTHRHVPVDMEGLSKVAFPVQRVQATDVNTGRAMDEDCGPQFSSAPYRFSGFGGIPKDIAGWFLSQGFIGHQMCAVMAQNWLINRACKIPAEDACRNGWKVDVDASRLEALEALDKEWDLKKKVEEFARFNRTYGIRVAMFVVESPDPLYYEKPFNIDGVAAGSYKGISQIDPMWCSPHLEGAEAYDPASCNFYEPTYWLIGDRKVHRSHLVIIRYSEVPDVLKPTYGFGGLPLPQLIWERVYGAERSANEGPQLLLTKRMNIIKTDLDVAAADPDQFKESLLDAAEMRDNYGFLPIGLSDEYSQADTSLGDVDAVIMTGYQLVAAVAEVPATKLIGTSPKGFNATGEFESGAYREVLATIQEHHMSPLLERHYELAQKSAFGDVAEFKIVWNPLDEPSAKEQADTNLVNAQAAQIYQGMGVISPETAERKLADDETAGWSQYITGDEETDGTETDADRALAAAIQSLITGAGVQPPTTEADPVDGERGGAGTEPQQQQ